MAFGSLGFGLGFSAVGASGPPVTRLLATVSAIPETSGAGVHVADLSIVGDDYVGPATYAITGDASGFFEIYDTDKIRTKVPAAFDYETLSSYPIAVEGTDTTTTTVYSKTVYAAITNVNEAPTAISLNANTIAENSLAGSVIGIFSATDVDAGDSAAWTLTADASGFFEIVGDQLRVKAGAALDYETATSHDITVQVTDGGLLTFSDTFTINVTDVDEVPDNAFITQSGDYFITQSGDYFVTQGG